MRLPVKTLEARRLRKLVGSSVVMMAVAFGGVAAGCGSDDDSGESTASGANETSSVVSDAKERVDAAMAPVTEWAGPTEGPKAASGKKILVINCGDAAEGCKRPVTGAREAAKTLGWEVTVVDSLGDPTKASDILGRAESMDVDGVILEAFPDAAVQAGLEKTKAAGIPVISVQGNLEVGPFDGAVTWDYAKVGELMADWIIADSDGEADILVMDDPQFQTMAVGVPAGMKVLETCDGCEVTKTVHTTVATLTTRVEGQAAGALRSAPAGQPYYVWSGYDALTSFIILGARSAGRTPEDTPMVSWGGNKENLNEIHDNGFQRATVAIAYEQLGWAAMDALVRVFADEEPVADAGIPMRFLTAENITPEMLSDGWSGDVDYAAKYTELWETGSTSK